MFFGSQTQLLIIILIILYPLKKARTFMERTKKISQHTTSANSCFQSQKTYFQSQNENNQNFANLTNLSVNNPQIKKQGGQKNIIPQHHSIEYLTNRIKDLQQQNHRYQERIMQLQSQNQQLMGVVVQASHHQVNRTKQFIKKVQNMILQKPDTFRTCSDFPSVTSRRMKTDHSSSSFRASSRGNKSKQMKKRQTDRNYERLDENERDSTLKVSNVYKKMRRSQLKRQVEGVKRIQKRVL